MTFDQFQQSLQNPNSPVDLSPYLRALWVDARGDWDGAHKIVQDIEDSQAAWIHAYLHRKEGDEGNARYWYGIAHKPFPTGQTLDEEWQSLVKQLLSSEIDN